MPALAPEHPGVAVVTGAASGIGAALPRRLLAAGHRVVGLDLAPSSLPNARRHDVAD